MKRSVVGIVLLTFFIVINAKPKHHTHDVSFNSVEEALFPRYILDQYFAIRDTDEIIFSEEQRKFQNDTLDLHNKLRAHHCVPPLVLDEEVNIRAQIYCDYLAKTDSALVHSTDRGSSFGENLYALTRKSPITNINGLVERVTMAWYAEISFYNYSNPTYNVKTGHFTQLVWKDTHRMGVGYALGREGRKLYVCAQYGPPGNYRYHFAENVLEPTCEEPTQEE